jgi:hypothetical protein
LQTTEHLQNIQQLHVFIVFGGAEPVIAWLAFAATPNVTKIWVLVKLLPTLVHVHCRINSLDTPLFCCLRRAAAAHYTIKTNTNTTTIIDTYTTLNTITTPLTLIPPTPTPTPIPLIPTTPTTSPPSTGVGGVSPVSDGGAGVGGGHV